MHHETVHHTEHRSVHLSIHRAAHSDSATTPHSESTAAHHSLIAEVHRAAANNANGEHSLFGKPAEKADGSAEKANAEQGQSAEAKKGEQVAGSTVGDLQITNQEKNLSTLLDKNVADQERLSTAMGLLGTDSTGVFSMKDSSGNLHELHIEKLEVDGKTVVRVSEGGQTLIEGVVEKATVARAASEYADKAKLETARADGLPKPPGDQPVKTAPSAASGADSGGHYVRVPKRRPAGMSYGDGGGGGGGGGGGRGHYSPPDRGSDYNPAGVDHSRWQGVRHSDGSVAISFRGCQVDTDGSGAYRHTEDATRQGQTSLRLSDGTSLDTDKHNFFVLPPSVAHAYGIKLGDLGWLVQKQSGNAVPVVFGDSGPEGKLGEASVAALKSLGYDNVSGANGVDKSEEFEIVFVPGSGNGTGDIANSPQAMAGKLASLGSAPDSKSGDSNSLPSFA